MTSAVEIGVELMNKQGKEYRAEIARLTKERDELRTSLEHIRDFTHDIHDHYLRQYVLDEANRAIANTEQS